MLFGQKRPGPPRRFGVKQPNGTDMWPPTVLVCMSAGRLLYASISRHQQDLKSVKQVVIVVVTRRKAQARTAICIVPPPDHLKFAILIDHS
jgi:hypothetical protein